MFLYKDFLQLALQYTIVCSCFYIGSKSKCKYRWHSFNKNFQDKNDAHWLRKNSAMSAMNTFTYISLTRESCIIACDTHDNMYIQIMHHHHYDEKLVYAKYFSTNALSVLCCVEFWRVSRNMICTGVPFDIQSWSREFSETSWRHTNDVYHLWPPCISVRA